MTTSDWQAVTSLPEQLPEFSLGLGVLNWCSTNIRQPDGPDAGGEWWFTPEQAKFVMWWYAVDHRGRFTFRRGVLRRMKGWGKSPVMAALALAELCGPVRFDRWEDGAPIGRPVSAPLVQLSGVAESQTQNTMSLVLAMVNESPLADELDVGLTRIYDHARNGKLVYVTSSAPTGEGARPTFVVEDETHHWKEGNGGHALHRVNMRNLGKSRDGSARLLETTNAHVPGEASVAEQSYEAWQAQIQGRGTGLLYDTREAPADIDLSDPEQRLKGLLCARGDSVWLDLERIDGEITDGSVPPSDSRRFYFNHLTHAISSWISEPEWASRLDVNRIVADHEAITVGFDGSLGRARGKADATALVGCTMDGHLFQIQVWEQPTGPAGENWQVPVAEVEAAVRSTFRRWNVVGFYADPAKWGDHVARWEAEYHTQLKAQAGRQRPIAWRTDRIKATVDALDSLHTAIVAGGMTHSGESALTQHFLHARRHDTPSGLLIRKETKDSPMKIDAAYAGMLAWQARLDAVAAGVGHTSQSSHAPFRIV